MMQKFSTPFKVGFVILIGLVMTIVMIVRFSANWGQSEGTYRLQAYFDDATGLAVRSQIKIAGIQVGEVESITLDGSRALVTFFVRSDIVLHSGIKNGDTFKNGATVSKQMSGIMGDFHLELTPGLEGTSLKDGDFIPNVLQGGGISGLLGSTGKVMEDVSEVTKNLAGVLGSDDGLRQLTEIMRDLNETIKNIKNITSGNAEQISGIIANLETISRNAADMSQTGNRELPMLVEDISKLIEKAHSTLDSVNSGVDSTIDSTNDGINQLRASIDRLEHTMASVETIAKNVENGKGTVGKLLNDEGIADEAQSLLSETRDLIKEGTETVNTANTLLSPLADLDVDISLRGDYMVRNNAFRVDFGVKLQPSFDKYYYLGLVMDPNGTTKTKTILTESTLNGTNYEKITTNDDSIKFSLQYARRWRWFVGRFGIIENTGGLGGDVLLFDDDLRFSADLFAFNDNEYPRLRMTALVYFSLFMPWNWAKTFYISAGVDDPINTELFDYYFGIGFRFSDNDVKSMLGIMPKP